MLSDIQSFVLMLPHFNAGEPTREHQANIAAHALNLFEKRAFLL